MAILSFKCSDTEALYHRQRVAPWLVRILSPARRKLRLLNGAISLDLLRSPYGNHLEALKGDREGQYSIRINDQYRVCFVWTDLGPRDVEIVDYH